MRIRQSLKKTKDYLKGKSGKGIPGGFYEKIVLDVLVKFVLDFLAMMIKPIVQKKMGKKLRHKNLNRDREIILNHLEEANLKYNDSFEVFIHFIYAIADHDVPYYQNYNSLIRCVQQKIPEKSRYDAYIHDLREDVEPKHGAEKTSPRKIREALSNEGVLDDIDEGKYDVSPEFEKLIKNRLEK